MLGEKSGARRREMTADYVDKTEVKQVVDAHKSSAAIRPTAAALGR